MKIIARLWVLALVACIAAVFSGCASASKVTRAEILIQCGTNVVKVVQPKDTVIGSMEFDPKTGKLTLKDYSSTANAAAIKAAEVQSAAQAEFAKASLATIQLLVDKYAQSQGIPRGMKLVPTDDPSRPQPEIEP